MCLYVFILFVMENIYINFLLKGNYLNKFLLLFCFVLFLNYSCFSATSDVPVTLQIMPWVIRYGISDTWLNFWSISVSWVVQEIERQFEDYFRVQDLKAADSGYYTTVVSAGLAWPLMTITWIYMKAWNIYPELLLGVVWNVVIGTNLLNYQSIYNNVTYIRRDNAPNYWKINKYWDKPWIKIVVPPYVSPWNYSWTIFFSLNEN